MKIFSSVSYTDSVWIQLDPWIRLWNLDQDLDSESGIQMPTPAPPNKVAPANTGFLCFLVLESQSDVFPFYSKFLFDCN